MCVDIEVHEAVEAKLEDAEYQIKELEDKVEELEAKAEVLDEMNEDLECRLHAIIFMAMDCGDNPDTIRCALQDIVSQASRGLTERWYTKPKGKYNLRSVSRRTPQTLRNKKRANKLITFRKRYCAKKIPA